MSAHPGQQPPRAADVPEAVLAAIRVALEAERELEAARHRFGQHATYEDLRPFVFRCRDASQAGVAAIATALREAREQGAADRGSLDWMAANYLDVRYDAIRKPGEPRMWRVATQYQDFAHPVLGVALQQAREHSEWVESRLARLDAARAAEPEGSDAA